MELPPEVLDEKSHRKAVAIGGGGLGPEARPAPNLRKSQIVVI
jgi:hypothetical protein